MHLELLAEHGGSAGIRDAGLLESALARPRNRSTIFKLAAGYAFGLTRNHPFLDGNKRTAFAAMAVFLELNGYELVAPQIDAYRTMLALAAGEMPEAELASWLKEQTKRL